MESFDLSLIQERFSKLKKLQYYEAKKRFYEIGTPDSYKKAEEIYPAMQSPKIMIKQIQELIKQELI